ncbi:unnamed protein product (macronuclear) [Paramecium tetraurelia]|uniref:Uncharacterized protein n=1 Tax=Paramecium tetraurelia TaxID=5888 RepID=A0DYC5_PARTE|nr:uncharacterized protein GSPATT00003010001 [Paramecium tetraurelia]CAK88042.1 unnamed protein product [Paramecium tetraurelia]|eukprot:XP_001455439.1 hypothetical protein (macronuclear) [Paramecium tetraurelia strain d4-2]
MDLGMRVGKVKRQKIINGSSVVQAAFHIGNEQQIKIITYDILQFIKLQTLKPMSLIYQDNQISTVISSGQVILTRSYTLNNIHNKFLFNTRIIIDQNFYKQHCCSGFQSQFSVYDEIFSQKKYTKWMTKNKNIQLDGHRLKKQFNKTKKYIKNKKQRSQKKTHQIKEMPQKMKKENDTSKIKPHIEIRAIFQELICIKIKLISKPISKEEKWFEVNRVKLQENKAVYRIMIL